MENLSDELEGFFYAEMFNLAKRAPTYLNFIFIFI